MSYSDTTKAVFDLAFVTLEHQTFPEVMEILRTALAQENLQDVDHVTGKLLSAVRKASDYAD